MSVCLEDRHAALLLTRVAGDLLSSCHVEVPAFVPWHLRRWRHESIVPFLPRGHSALRVLVRVR
jgi:hypothetical protein